MIYKILFEHYLLERCIVLAGTKKARKTSYWSVSDRVSTDRGQVFISQALLSIEQSTMRYIQLDFIRCVTRTRAHESRS